MGNVRNLVYCNFVVWEKNQWFWSINFNALFSRNIESGQVKRWGQYVKYGKKGSETAYNNVILYDRKIIAIPGRERKIMIFDIETKSFRYVNLDVQFVREEDNAFFSYVVLGKWLFMIGNEIPYVVKFDMDSEEILQTVNLGIHVTYRNVFFRDAILDKDKLILPLMGENIVFEMDADTLQWTKRKVGDAKDGFSAACRTADSIWLMPRQQGAVLQWSRENDRIITHEIKKEGIKYNRFHSAHIFGKRIWVFPFQGNKVFSFDAETGELIKENAINRYIKTVQARECIVRAAQAEGEQIFLLCYCADEWVRMIFEPERDKLVISPLKCEVSYEELYKIGIDLVDEKELPFQRFIDYLVDKNANDGRGPALTRYDYGNQIWKTVN